MEMEIEEGKTIRRIALLIASAIVLAILSMAGCQYLTYKSAFENGYEQQTAYPGSSTLIWIKKGEIKNEK